MLCTSATECVLNSSLSIRNEDIELEKIGLTIIFNVDDYIIKLLTVTYKYKKSAIADELHE